MILPSISKGMTGAEKFLSRLSSWNFFEQRYENGYDLYTDVDYVAWLMECHPEDVPDEILDEMGSNFENARSDPFQLFEKEPSGVNTNTCIRKHRLCESVSLLPSNKAEVNLSSSQPSVEQTSGSTSCYTSETLSVISDLELTTSSQEVSVDHVITNSSSSTKQSLVLSSSPLSSLNIYTFGSLTD